MSVRRVSEITSQMRTALDLSEPGIDTTIGSPLRKVLDAVSEVVAEAYVDAHLMEYQYDIDVKSGADLDDFVRLFGFTRFPAKRGVGTVTFDRGASATDDVLIPINTQLSTEGSAPVIVQTIVPALLLAGETSVQVPVQSVIGGTVGNVPANAVKRRISALEGIASFTNPTALTGGADAESDEQLRERFKNTVFRNMAGTECQPPGTMVMVPLDSGSRRKLTDAEVEEIRESSETGAALVKKYGVSPATISRIRSGLEYQDAERTIDKPRPVVETNGMSKVRVGYVPIESLSVGDRVVSFNHGATLIRGRAITKIGFRDYSGPLIVVQSDDGRVSRYTPNHRCLAKLGPAVEGKSIVYLMKRGTSYRVGKTIDRHGTNAYGASSGVASRLNSQDADAIWILSVHDTSDEALLAEALASHQFGIPSTLFKATKHEREGKQEWLDVFWNKVGDLTDRAQACLTHFGRLIEYPLIERGGRRKIWNRTSEVRACNLIDGCEVIDIDATLAGRDGKIPPPAQRTKVAVRFEFYEGPVWSMDVDEHHTYVADGFATHNSNFLGIALDDESVNHANVIGATKTRRETIELSSGSATSTVQDATYIYPDSETFGPDIDVGNILTPGVHYEFDHSVIPPEVNSLGIPDGVYDLVFEYVPQASRNDPTGGITNRVDIYVDGSRPTEATEDVVFQATRLFDNTPGSPYNVANFARANGDPPAVGNFLVAFAFAPVIEPSIEGVIKIDGTDYHENVEFFLVNDITNSGGTPNSLSGIEVVSNANAGPTNPTDGVQFLVNYIFNAVPRDIEVAARQWRLITTDVRVHQAKIVLLNLNIAILLEQGYPLSAVTSQIELDVAQFIGTIGFHGVLQVSDLMEVIAGVPGVDAVRFLNDGDDNTAYAMQRVNSIGDVIETYEVGGRAADVVLADDEYPAFNALRVELRALNSFGVV